ncbi:ribonuclease P protein subunit p14 [Exaiptasia diaphana]|uniref:Uncharacterized protein n=1 Tax=Exaiptasia diaphana TaxID=2652724 RepID=A0A913XIF6_EXADI|nr:ribonuclease P protein subunit p14 [Exaiptasia diaphana]KXJ25942.1 Ribonuclease P protein subunit p14 [Exaiptasia diaphana]
MEKFTLPQKAEHFYLKVALEFEERDDEESSVKPVLDILSYKKLILEALEQLHGQVGGALVVDVLKYEQTTSEAILRVKESGLVKVWSALTLLGYYKDHRCAFHICQVSPHLMALAVDSRKWKPKADDQMDQE